MYTRKGKSAIVVAMAAMLAACSSGPRHGFAAPHSRHEWHPPREALLKYDFNHDGSVTRAEMETGLRADFAAADTNHDGCLEADEVRAVNERRWKEQASTATPLIDWTQSGCIAYDGYAAADRSLFDEMDRDGDGTLSPREMGVRKPADRGHKGHSQGQGRHGGQQ